MPARRRNKTCRSARNRRGETIASKMDASTASSVAKRRQATGQGSAAAPANDSQAGEDDLNNDSFVAATPQKADKVADGETREEVSPSRRSPMSVGKYNQWILVDANRRMGIEVRVEEAALARRREASTAAYHEARSKKTAVGKGQQELTAHSVREYRGSLAKCGEQGRSELLQLRTLALRQKKEWAAHGARNASRLGLEQKKRVLEARAERFQTRRNAALQTKNEAAARKLMANSASAVQSEEKKLRLERARQNMPDAESLAEAREFFAKQKRDAAAEVRSAARTWETSIKAEKSTLLAKANANRATVVATRNQAAEHRAHAKDERMAMAAKIRAALKDMEGERKRQVEQSREQAVLLHRDLYERKFVDDEAADRVDSSEYGQLVRASVTAGMSSLSVTSMRSASSPPKRLTTSAMSATPGSSAASRPAAKGTYRPEGVPPSSAGSRVVGTASLRGLSGSSASAPDISDPAASWTDSQSALGPTA